MQEFAHISSLPSSLWTAGLPISILTAHPSMAASLPRMRSGPPSCSWIKLVNSLSPITNPEGMLLLTRCHLDFILLLTPLQLGGPCNFPHFFIDHISHKYQKFDPTYRGSCGITYCPLLKRLGWCWIYKGTSPSKSVKTCGSSQDLLCVKGGFCSCKPQGYAQSCLQSVS